jgi:hypothetical protein
VSHQLARRAGAWLVFWLAVGPAGAAAAEPPASPDKVEWKLAAQGGLILSTGNSRVTTFAVGAAASRKASRNKFSLEAGAAYARSRILLAVDEDGSGDIDAGEVERASQTTARSWQVKARYDRFVTPSDAGYAAASISADQPAGKELVGSGQIGYSRQVYQDSVHLLVAEAGYDLTYEDQVAGDGVAIHSLRGFTGYTGKLSASSAIEASAEALSNLNELKTSAGAIDSFEDNRVNGKLSVTAVLFRDVSLRAGFEVRYDHAPAPRPPVGLPYAPGFTPLASRLDTRTEVAFIVNFL